MKLLICEGVCNPSIRIIDREIEATTKRLGVEDGNLVLSDRVGAFYRQATYTPHEPVGQSTTSGGAYLEYACTRCGARRRFGGPLYDFRDRVAA